MVSLIDKSSRKIRVAFLMRKQRANRFSIELVADALEKAMPDEILVSRWNCWSVKGFFIRLVDCFRLFFIKADIFHIVGDVHFLMPFLAYKKTVLTIHDVERVSRLSGIKKQLYQLIWFRAPLHIASCLVAISESTKYELMKSFQVKKQIHVIPDPLVLKIKKNSKIFSSTEHFVALHVGTKKNKNLEANIAAIREIPCKLIIIGKLIEQQKKALTTNCIDYENFERLTNEEMSEIYSKVDVLLFTSLVEGFGLPIIEAQAAGVPVITSNCSSMPEVAGEGAVFVDPTSVESIRTTLLDVVMNSSLRKRIIDNGYRNADRFTPSRVAQMYVNLYKELCSPLSSGER